MQLPDSWRVGAQSGVSPIWMKEFEKYVGQASSVNDIWTLRNVLEARKNWVYPVTCRALSGALEARAKAIGGTIAPVESEIEDRPWHAYQSPFGAQPLRKPKSAKHEATE